MLLFILLTFQTVGLSTMQNSAFFTPSDSEEEEGYELVKPPSAADESKRKRYEAEKAGYEIINDLSAVDNEKLKKQLEKKEKQKLSAKLTSQKTRLHKSLSKCCKNVVKKKEKTQKERGYYS